MTKLDGLIPELAREESWPSVVVLTGDAGDGKTQFCAKLADSLGHVGPLMPVTPVNHWVIIKDASEIPEADLVEILQGASHDSGRRILVAINEGRLRRLARGALSKRQDLVERVIRPSLETWLSEADAAGLEEAMRAHRWLVLNFRHRFHVRAATPALLDAWTRAELWEDGAACGSCSARETCPILANVTDLRAEKPRAMLCDALASVHFSGQRLPLRRLQAVVALACTGGLSCEKLAENELGAMERLRYRYYDVLFAREAVAQPIRVEPELLCRSLAPLDPGRMARRDVDREIALAAIGESEATSQALPPLERAALEEVRATGRSGDEEATSVSGKLALLTRHLRRLLAFSRADDSADWQRALRLLEGFARDGDDTALLEGLTQGLNGLHRQGGNKERITSRQLDPGGFREPARLALELDLGLRFEARLERGPVLPEEAVAPWMESCPADLYLVVAAEGDPQSSARLHLDARLVAALLGSREGFVQLGALGSYRRDLARFFGRLVTLAASREPGPRVILRRGGERRALDVVDHDETPRLVMEVDA
ncbi:MAG: hypothetical protein RLP09_17055 [Sandaracinaceae bacterium]